MSQLQQDRVFVALTRPQMFAGVTYNIFIINFILTTELFLIFKSLWVLLPAIAFHIVGMLLCLRDPRMIDVWLARARLCGRVPNYRYWRCNSYRP
jgi:type IV secretion system protein VirB3